MTEGTIIIRKGREKPIIQQHPWIFSGSIAHAENASPGDIVTVRSITDKFLGRGYWNPQSQIQVRILTWQDEPINDEWWRRMLQRAIDGRGIKQRTFESGDNPHAAFRLVNAENDYLPGLIVDRYDRWLVIQALTLGIDQRKPLIAKLLTEMLRPMGIYERSDVDVREKEGLAQATGTLWGVQPPEHIKIKEGAVELLADVVQGHKTGLYLDQEPNRLLLQKLLSEEVDGPCRLLNMFSYTGGFALQALAAGGVHAICVDSSREALNLAETNIRLNDFHLNQHEQSYELIEADCFAYLRDAVARNDSFDIVVLDPPKFAHNKQQVDRAARGYKDLNLNAFKLIKSGGYLLTFSCSGAIDADLFQKIVFGALADSGRQAQILQKLGPGSDHPVALTFPEGDYLKGLLLKVY